MEQKMILSLAPCSTEARKPTDISKWDILLHPCLAAKTESEFSIALEQLVGPLKPGGDKKEGMSQFIHAKVKRKLAAGGRQAAEEIDDIVAGTLFVVLNELQTRLADPKAEPIQSLRAWTARVASNETSAYLRKKYPLRRSVEDKIRYLMEGKWKRPGIAIWIDADGERVGGFEVWETKGMASASPRLQRLLEEPRRGIQKAIQAARSPVDDPAKQIGAVLQAVGHPVPVDDLIRLMAELWNKKDLPDAPLGPGLIEPAIDPKMPATIVLEFEMDRLWKLILQLNASERAALLLQARDTDGNALIELLISQEIAGFCEIARAAGLTPEELTALRNNLPLDDALIAKRLNVPVSRITMLRYNARERLRRQTAKEE